MKLRGAFLALAVAALLAAPASASAAPSLRHLIGSRLLVAMHGTRPDAQLLVRVRRGEVAGVILFGSNIEGPRQLSALTAALRRAARAGRHLPPLVAVDQEGGAVKRLSWAPPTLSPPQIGARNSLVVAGHQGRSTARALRALGINLDLAPVCDVPRGPDSFIAAQGRAYSRSRFVVARMASAFAGGLGRGRVAATLKHFPGLGRATVSTDDGVVRILADRPAIRRDLSPFRSGVRHGAAVVMLSTAIYPAFDFRAAAWSPPLIQILRRGIGFRGVTVTDSLDGAAALRGQPLSYVARRAARAGSDLLLLTGSEAASAAVYGRLLADARAGRLPRAGLVASFRRVHALRQRYG